jgi:hypothetical protein
VICSALPIVKEKSLINFVVLSGNLNSGNLNKLCNGKQQVQNENNSRLPRSTTAIFPTKLIFLLPSTFKVKTCGRNTIGAHCQITWRPSLFSIISLDELLVPVCPLFYIPSICF